MTEKIRLNVNLDEEASQIAQREMAIHRWKKKTQLVNEIFKRYDSFKQALEVIQKEPQKPKSISWDDPNLEPCVFRDLKGNELICRNKKAPLNTDNLTPNVCLACQELRKQCSITLSTEVKTIISEYARKEKIDFNKALKMMIKENDRLHAYLRYWVRPEEREVPECIHRIFDKDKARFYCVDASREKGCKKVTLLPSLEVCKSCTLNTAKIPARTKIQNKQKTRKAEKEWRDPFESHLPVNNNLGKNFMGDT